MSMPGIGIAGKRSATRELAELIDSADMILKKLDAVIGIVRMDQNVFYNKYRTMRRTVSHGGGNVAIKVQVSPVGLRIRVSALSPALS